MKEKIEIVEGEILNKTTANFIREHLITQDTRNAQSSLRKAIVSIKDETKEKVSISTIVNAINRYHPVSKISIKVLSKLVEMAEEKEREEKNKLAELAN